jgi:hypothetical protein
MAYYPILPLFPIGALAFSEGAESLGIDLFRYIRRHMSGDWGEVSDYDLERNQDALNTDGEILSQYNVTDREGASRSLSIMTEADRSVTVAWLDHEDPDIDQANDAMP